MTDPDWLLKLEATAKAALRLERGCLGPSGVIEETINLSVEFKENINPLYILALIQLVREMGDLLMEIRPEWEDFKNIQQKYRRGPVIGDEK